MQSKSITILSSRGRGISADLSLMRMHLVSENNMENVVFRSFSKNERTDNDVINQGVAKMRRQFCEKAEHVICIDASFNGKINDSDGMRLLLASPYDYQFKNTLLAEKKPGHFNALKKFTHIIAGSPFTEKLLQNSYHLEGTEIIGQTALPLAWEVCQEERRRAGTEKIAFYYPEMLQKKVMVILMAGAEAKKDLPFFGTFPVREFMDKLGKDWFVFTNSMTLMENAYTLPARYRSNFGYINHLMQIHDLLYTADVLLTNNGRMAASFAGCKKPTYCLLCNNSSYEQYMKVKYRELCIANADEMFRCPWNEKTEALLKFCDDFYYSGAQNPFKKTAELLSLGPTG